MKKVIYVLVLLLTVSGAQGQNRPTRKITLITHITETNKNKTTGFLHSVTDSGIFLMDLKKPVYTDVERSKLYKIEPQLIEAVTMRKPRQIAKGAGFGILAGAIGGALIGLATYRDPGPGAWFDFGPGFNALGGAGIGIIAGGVTGIIVSIHPKRYRISGAKTKYRSMLLHFNNRIAKAPKSVQ
jgi:hypothetical protein